MTTTTKTSKIDYAPSTELVKFFDMLARRWQDEKDYEDHADYVTAITKQLPKGSRDVHLSGMVCRLEYTTPDGVERFVKIRGNKIVTGYYC
jgi:hypothetical protein